MLKNAEDIELNIRLQNKHWESYNQENNYSFINDITAEYDGNIIYGTVPQEVEEEEKIIKINSKMYNKQIDKDSTAIYPWIKIKNSGNLELDLSKLEIRYYYTVDSDTAIEEDVIIDWSNIGKEKVITQINSIHDREEADRYLSIKLNSIANVDRLGQANGGINISAGIDKAIDELKDSKDRNKKIILLTDGEGTFNNSTIDNAKKNSIKIYTIGLGTDFGGDLIGDGIYSDLYGVVLGLPSRQLYKAYELTAKVMEKYKGKEIYITGHSLGGWLATKVTGTIINTDDNISKQIPLSSKIDVKKFKNTIKANSHRLMKSVPLASPGFVASSSIEGKNNQIFRDKLFSYKMDSDPVSIFGFDAILRGNVKFINSKIALDKSCNRLMTLYGHLLSVYYHHFDQYFDKNLSYDFETMDTR